MDEIKGITCVKFLSSSVEEWELLAIQDDEAPVDKPAVEPKHAAPPCIGPGAMGEGDWLMYAAVRPYEGITDDAEAGRLVRESFLPHLERADHILD